MDVQFQTKEMTTNLLENMFDSRIVSSVPLGDCNSSKVLKVDFENGKSVVFKYAAEYDLTIERFMLEYLAKNTDLPVPKVWSSSQNYLITEFLPGQTGLEGNAQIHAADILAQLHNITAPQYGFERDTLFGFHQLSNKWQDRWVDFFRDQRLLPAALGARESGDLPVNVYEAVLKVAGKLQAFLPEPKAPSLLHGDLWRGNILSQDGRVTGVVDPAISFGNRESELAHGTLYDAVFQQSFFDRYNEHYPLDQDFFDVRRHLLNLYPLIIYTRVFKNGASLRWVDEISKRFA